MPKKTYVRALTEALKPFGFARDGDDWTRVRGDLWECVNLQRSWLGGVTVNLRKDDLATKALLKTIPGEPWTGEMDARIGEIIDGYDRWWSNDPDGPDEVAALVLQYGLPWFEKVNTLEEQAANWYGRGTTSRGYHSRSLIGLAATLYRMGELDEALEVLRKPVPKTAIPSGVAQVVALRTWIQQRAAQLQADRR